MTTVETRAMSILPSSETKAQVSPNQLKQNK